METTKFFVPNISCSHCVMTIKREVGGIEGVLRVEGDAIKKELIVEWSSPASIEKIKEMLKAIDYPAAP